MEPLFEMDFTQKKFEQYLRVYDDYIEMRKVKPSSGLLDIFHPSFFDFVCRIDMLEKVEITPANSRMATGIIQFFKKGEESKKATSLNVAFLGNAFNFTSKQNEEAQKIYEFVNAKIQGNA